MTQLCGQITRDYVFGHKYDPAIFEAFTEMAKEKLAGKEHNTQRPKTAMRFEIDDWHTLTFKPQILPPYRLEDGQQYSAGTQDIAGGSGQERQWMRTDP